MLGLLLVLSTLLYLGPESADAVSITNVTVPGRVGWVVMYARPPWDPASEDRIEFRCEYTISPAPATPPTITWLRGAFADADREIIYKWSSSGEVYVHPDFAGRATIESRTSPTLILTNEYTWNRYWCRVTNEEQPDEFGTDEESLLFWFHGGGFFNAPTRLSMVNLDKTPVHVKVGGTARLDCTGTDGHTASILWVKGPVGCSQGGSCSSYETVIHKPALPLWWDISEPDPSNITVSPNYGGRVSLAANGRGSYTPTLTITDIRPSDAGRYWCAPDIYEGYSHLKARNRGAQSVVIIVNDQPSCDGKADGMYQDPSDCSRYYTCSAGVLHGPSPCLSGLVFNQALQVCDWPYNVACV